MTDILEQDALKTLPETPPIRDHPHEELTSFVATPRYDEGMMQKARAWITGNQGSSAPIVCKSSDGLRYMFLITSNAYEDREGETITSDALKAYEASCYPGDGLFHCDNPLLWWHDDDVVMGEIVAVDYVEPFLVEMAKEIDDPLSKILWDYAENNGDAAGTSHRFGYREGDRSREGVYTRIFKQETSYLPERALAANDKTYAGVLKPMATPQSDQRLSQMIEEATGLKDMASQIHADISAAKKKLSDAGLAHKSFPPAKKPADAPPAQAVAQDVAAEEDVKEDAADAEMAVADMPAFMNIMNQIYTLVMEMVDSQMGGMDQQMTFAKALTALEEKIDATLISEKATKQTLEDEVKALRLELSIVQKRLDLKPRSVTLDKGGTPESIKTAVDVAEQARIKGETVNHSFWGDLLPLPKG